MASEIGIPVPTRACDSIWNSQQKPTENIVSFFVVHLGFSEVYKSCPSNLVWSGVVWRGLMKTAVQDSHFFLEQQWSPLSLTDASWLFKNKKLFVGNLLLFFNKMLACVGCIFKALYMALRVSLYLSSSIWGMPRDLSYDHFCVFCWPMCCLCVTPKGIYSGGFLFVCGHHHLGLLFLACAFEEGGHSTF